MACPCFFGISAILIIVSKFIKDSKPFHNIRMGGAKYLAVNVFATLASIITSEFQQTFSEIKLYAGFTFAEQKRPAAPKPPGACA